MLPTGKGVRSGSLATGGQYDLVGTGYSRVHTVWRNLLLVRQILLLSGAFASDAAIGVGNTSANGNRY